MSRHGENIFKRKDGRWEGRYIKERNQNGKATYGYVYAKSYKEVKQKLETKKIETYHQIHKKSQNQTFKHATMETIGKLWIETIRSGIKESTFVKYYNLFYKHILPELGNISLDEIGIDCLEQFASLKQQSGRLDGKGGLSSKTVKDMITVIREILRYAKLRGICISNDFTDFRMKGSETSMNLISESDQYKLEQYLIANNTPRNLGILLSLYMGLRIGELCALQWKDILLEERIIRIRCTMQRIQQFSDETSNTSTQKTKIIMTTPKSESSSRDIPIPIFLIPLIRAHQTQIQETFFLSGSEQKFVEPRSYQYYFKTLLKKCEIPYINFHVLRHTFATRCIENGFDSKSLSEILGHSSVNITLNKYVHASMDIKRKNMLKMNLLALN